MYVLSKLKICIHILNAKRVHNSRQETQRYTCIVISFGQKLHIHEAKAYAKIGKTSVNEGIIKTKLYMYM